MPANIELSGIDVTLVNTMSRETILKQYIETVKRNYDYVIVDCMPSLGMMTVNALAAANSIIIPVQAQYLSVKGLEQLLQSVARVRRQINPELSIAGILITMVDSRTNYSKDIISLLKKTYNGKLNIFDNNIPLSVRASEISAAGKSIYVHDSNGKVAQAYDSLTKEVLSYE
jgi:chromosome partitioning protein